MGQVLFTDEHSHEMLLTLTQPSTADKLVNVLYHNDVKVESAYYYKQLVWLQ